MKRFRQRMLLFFIMTAGLLLTGCSAVRPEAGPAPDGGERVRVAATIFPPCDFVRQIGGEYVDVVQLLKPGMEPHSYEPSPADIIRIMDSDLFLYAGGESDDAVQLSRGKRTGPSYRHNAVVKRLEFDRWKKHEDKASSARVEAVSIKRGAKGEVRTAEGSLQSSEKNS